MAENYVYGVVFEKNKKFSSIVTASQNFLQIIADFVAGIYSVETCFWF